MVERNPPEVTSPHVAAVSDPLVIAGLPETINSRDDAKPLVEVIETQIPDNRRGSPLSAINLFLGMLALHDEAAREGNVAERAMHEREATQFYARALAEVRGVLAALPSQTRRTTQQPPGSTATAAPEAVPSAMSRSHGPAPAAAPPWPRVPMLHYGGLCLGDPAVPPATITDGIMAITLSAAIQRLVPAVARTDAMREVVSGVNALCALHQSPDPQQAQKVNQVVVDAYPKAYRDACAYLDTPERQRLVAESADSLGQEALRVLEPDPEPADAGLTSAAPTRATTEKAPPRGVTVAPRPKLAAASKGRPEAMRAAPPSAAMVSIEPVMVASYAEQARDLLAQCTHIEEAKSFVSKAETFRAYLRSVHASLAARASAEEVVLRARRRLGELTRELPKAAPGPKGVMSQAATQLATGKADSLADLGISRQEASRLEKLAGIATSDFDSYISATKAAGKTPSTSGALALVKTRKAADRTTPYAVAEASRMRSHVGRLKSLQGEVSQAAEEWASRPAAGLTEIAETWNEAASALGTVLATLAQVALPKGACPCGGAARCRKCSGRGWLPAGPEAPPASSSKKTTPRRN